MLPGIRPTVLGTLSIELVVVVCAVRVEMACGPGAWQPLQPTFTGPQGEQHLVLTYPPCFLRR